MDLKALLAKLFSEGKTDAEIASAIAAYKGADAPSSVDALASAVEEGRKAFELAQKLTLASAKREEEAQKKATDTELEQRLEEKLKTITLSLQGAASTSKTVKRFNRQTKKIEEHVVDSDIYHGFNDMIRAIGSGDKASAKSISDEIDKDNLRQRHGAKATPTVTDVTTRGGFAIPTEVNLQIMQLTQALSRMLPLVNQDVIIYESKVYPVMYGLTVDYVANQSTAFTESNPTFTNPTIDMQRLGAFSTLSHNFIREKGNDGVNAFINAYSSAVAKKLDQQIAVGNISGSGDKLDGVVFDAKTSRPTDIALASLTLANLHTLLETLHEDATGNLAFVANRKVRGRLGLLENTAGQFIFPQYVNGGAFAPFGVPFIENRQIPSTLDVGGDARVGGTDDVLIVADFSKVVVGLDENLRIATSEDFLFTTDVITLKVIQEFGMKVLMGASDAGIVAVAQGLTN